MTWHTALPPLEEVTGDYKDKHVMKMKRTRRMWTRATKYLSHQELFSCKLCCELLLQAHQSMDSFLKIVR